MSYKIGIRPKLIHRLIQDRARKFQANVDRETALREAVGTVERDLNAIRHTPSIEELLQNEPSAPRRGRD